MNLVLTGSLGNIGEPLTRQLVQKGHAVTVISSSPERQPAIEALGAKAAIGTILDIDFLTDTFRGADVVYLMEALPPSSLFDPTLDIINAYSDMAARYKQAVERSGVKKVVHLSSIGAHTTEGNGVLAMHYYAEQILNQLPGDISIKFMRPVGFFSNLYRSVQTIKTQGVIISNYGGDAKEPWVSPTDIATTVAEDMETPFAGRTIRYIASDDVSPNEIARTLGQAIGKPDLQWVAIADDELLNGMIAMGMNPQIAKGFVEMQAAQGTGALYDDYYKHQPTLGKTKLHDFAEDFVKAFNQ
ncbi:NAD(P)H-binding protein [Spirosoma linguale]|uniref:NmrA family protein n=1 Tax=Spirosoma linguale (strain ATCC 33905 / DSM 74 / LMG 10896 / Claus 1) TaxID=504472 RepID=D2QIT2_SPILD|nr:NmrA family protein [Spirosoma linguale DSM 74]